jgi:hypothetical protein
MRHVSCALPLVTAFACSQDRSVSFDPRVARGALAAEARYTITYVTTAPPCPEAPPRPNRASLKTPVVAEPAF